MDERPIGERRLFIVGDDGQTEVAVRLFVPRLNTAHDWECRFEIGWPDGVLARAVFGIDAVQALELAMKMIGIDLYTSEAHETARLVWLTPGDGYGFPVTVNVRDMMIGQDKQL